MTQTNCSFLSLYKFLPLLELVLTVRIMILFILTYFIGALCKVAEHELRE